MGTTRKLIIGIACLGIFAVLLLFLLRDREPRYQGVELSEWLRRYGKAVNKTNTPATQEASHAVLAIGTNALPQLLKWMAYEPAAWRMTLAYSRSLPDWLTSRAASALYNDVNMKRRLYAHNGFRILGAQAAMAVPELTTRLGQTNQRVVRHGAALALCSIGPDGLPPLINALHGSDPKLRGTVVTAIMQTPAAYNSAALIPGLIHSTKDATKNADEMVAAHALSTLARMRRDPAKVFPALTNCLNSTNFVVRKSALLAFSEQYLNEAHSVLPEVRNLLNDPNPIVRWAASKVLAQLETNNPAKPAPSP